MNTRKYLWLVFGIIGSIINLINSDSSYRDSQPFPMALSGFFLGALLGFVISLIIDLLGNSKIIHQGIHEIKEKKELKTNLRNSMNEYNEARESYQYLSNETLLSKYSSYIKDDANDMKRLALEEELVKRKLIEYSPMHEKLDKIKTNLKE